MVQTKWSRRGVLAATGAAPLAATHMAAASEPSRSVDVVIVGAGAAGVEAARLLVAAGRSVIVLEAADRVGGRLKKGMLAGKVIDLGGQWAGPGQDTLYQQAQALGIATLPQNVTGHGVMLVDGQPVRGGLDSFAPEDAEEFGRVVEEFHVLTAATDARAPWTAENARHLDRQSMAAWMDQTLTRPMVRALLTTIIRVVCTVEPSQLSMLAWARYMAAAGGFLPLIDTEGGAQQDVFVGGAHQIVQKTADLLGERIVLKAPVTKISHTADDVRVHSTQGVWRCRHVIVTAPPALAARMTYDPPLPAARDTLCQRMPMGSVIKCLVAYERPYWRDQGLSGQATTDRPFLGFFEKELDGSPHGAIVGFFAGAEADLWAQRTQDARRAEVTATIAAALGPGLPEPIDYVDQVWKDEAWCRGGYTGIPMPDTLALVGSALSAPIGRLHWAGTETADKWTGYIEGALQSAARAVAELGGP